MPDHPTRLPAAAWVSLAGFVLLAALAWNLKRPATFGIRFRSAPDAPRSWAEASYREALAPSLRLPSTALAALPSCIPTLRPGTTDITWEWPTPDLPASDLLREIFTADAAGVVTLPDGTQLALEAVALLLPSDAPAAGRPGGSEPNVRPVWHHPVSGAPWPRAGSPPTAANPGPGDPSSAWTEAEHPRPTDRPRLLLRIRKDGPAPMRWHWPRAFDPRTLLPDSRSASHSVDETHGAFWLDLETWHQAPRRIAVGFAFGEPEFQELPLRPGTRVSFASGGVVECLGLHPGRFPSRSWGQGSGLSSATFFSDASTGPSAGQSAVLWMWPPHHWENTTFHGASGAQVHAGSSSFGQPMGILHLSSGPGHRAQPPDSPPTIRLRHFPRLGRAVFDLPSVPRLPETKNLFAVPIPAATVKELDEMLDLAAAAAGVSVARSGRRVPAGSSSAPLTVQDTTPAQLMEAWQRQTGVRLRRDFPEKHRLTDQPPPGLWEPIREAWRSLF